MLGTSSDPQASAKRQHLLKAIVMQCSLLSKIPRTAKQITKGWQYKLKEARKKAAAYRKQVEGTGGGPYAIHLTEEETAYLDIVGRNDPATIGKST